MIPIIIIPRIIEPDEDEMFASWIIRLGKENLISNTRLFLLAFIYPNISSRYRVFPRADFRLPFAYFWRALRPVHNIIIEPDLFRRVSTFTGVAPLMTKAQRQRYLNQSFYTDREKEPLFEMPHGTIDGLYICPACVEEELKEKGYLTLHRAHHLPGVSVCHKHGRALARVEEIFLNITLDRMPECTQLSPGNLEIAHRYAVFAKDFMDEGLDCSVDDLMGLILARKTDGMIERMTEEGYDSVAPKLYLLLKQKNQKYITPSSILACLMYLFDADASAVRRALAEGAAKDKSMFLDRIQAEGYELISGYREDIVALRHRRCGGSFCTSPYGFLAGWGCPECGKELSLQEQYKRLVYNLGEGEYEPLSDLKSLDAKVSFRHKVCGKTIETKARAFLYEGVRCDCGRRVDFEKARAEVEKNEGFTLIEYTRTDKPIRVRHSCGGEFSINYTKFIQSPRCRVCERQGHLQERTTDDLLKDIRDLTGDEYTLLDEYKGPRTPVRIRHNKCGQIREYMPHRFLDGQRCDKCRNPLTVEAFCEFVKKYTFGRYVITERPTSNLYRIHDNETGRDVDMLRLKIMQELMRPTPSKLIPLDKKDDTAVPEKDDKKQDFLSYLRTRFQDGIVFMEDIDFRNAAREDIQRLIKEMTEMGELQRLGMGVYKFTGRTCSPGEVITLRYILRDGHRIGFFRGQDYAYRIGLEERPTEWHIATNRESAKTPPRKLSFMGETVHIKGSPVPITDENYLVLGAMDFLIQYKQHTDRPVKDVMAAVRHYIRTQNAGALPDKEMFDSCISTYKTANIRTMMTRLVEALYNGG